MPLVGMAGKYDDYNNGPYNGDNYDKHGYEDIEDIYDSSFDVYIKNVRKKINKGSVSIEKFMKRNCPSNPLEVAIGMDAPDRCTYFLEKGSNPDGSKKEKGRLLRRAMISYNPSRTVELLLKKGATITGHRPCGDNLLLFTMSRACYNRIREYGTIAEGALLERLHHVLAHKDSMKLINCKDEKGNTALGWAMCDLSDRIGRNWHKRKECVDTKEAIAIVDLLLAHGENPDLATHGQIALHLSLFQRINVCRQIEKSDYAPFLRYIPKRHQQFKNDCSDRLANYLMKLIPYAEGPSSQLPFEMILKIAKQRWDCDED